MNSSSLLLRSFVLSVLFLSMFTSLFAQDQINGNGTSTDQSLKSGFELLAQKKYKLAAAQFESAMNTYTETPVPSEWLFSKIQLSDEDPGDATSNDSQVRQITGFRHAMGTKQAILMFLAFTAQLQGDKALASKYNDAIYNLQSPLWGLSWRIFIPPVEALFHSAVSEDTSENYARYEFMAGELLYSADEKKPALVMLKKAQELLPKDAEIARSLAGYLLIEFDPLGARKYGEISVNLNPKQGRVYIDLGTACWLLGDLDAAVKYASMAQKLESTLPGPHGTLALAALEKGEMSTASEEAAEGVKLSNRFPFYLTIQAVVLEATGKRSEAEKLMKEAWEDDLPGSERLKKWFFRGRSLDLALKIVARLCPTK